MSREKITILCLTLITGLVLYFSPENSRDITISVTSGLIGYLAREQKGDTYEVRSN